jgi:hypothetical protein
MFGQLMEMINGLSFLGIPGFWALFMLLLIILCPPAKPERAKIKKMMKR